MVLARHRADLLENAYREFKNNLLWIQIDGYYMEQKHFQEAVLYLIFNICKLNPTNMVGNIIHEFLKTFFLKNQTINLACISKSGTKYYRFSGKTTGRSNGKNNLN